MSRAQKEVRRAARRRRNPFIVLESNLNRLGPGLISKINDKVVSPLRTWAMREWAATLRSSFFACNCDLDRFARELAITMDWFSDREEGNHLSRWGDRRVYQDRIDSMPFLEIAEIFVSLHREFLTEQIILGVDSNRTSFKDLHIDFSVYHLDTLG